MLLSDALGSVVGLADEGGWVSDEYAYSAFGESVHSGADDRNSLGYTGREDDGTGLLYYRARYYDPGLKRFVSADPIGLAGGINVYAYVENSPLSWGDPFGLLAGGAVNAGEGYGECAAQYWSDLAEETGNPLYHILGALAALWTNSTSDATLAVLVSATGGSAVVRAISTKAVHQSVGASATNKVPKPGITAKQGAKDIPSWVKGERPLLHENGKDFATRLLNDRYGPGNYPRGPGSEFNKIKKWGDRAFVDP